MKQFTAIWFSLLLVLAQIAPTPAAASSPDCCRVAARRHAGCRANMPCCAAKSAESSEPAPVAPTSSGNETQISLIVQEVAIWTLPSDEAKVSTSAPLPSIASADTPLYTRHCALLL